MPSYFKIVFLSTFCNITPSKSCKTTLKPEIHCAFDVLQLDKMKLRSPPFKQVSAQLYLLNERRSPNDSAPGKYKRKDKSLISMKRK